MRVVVCVPVVVVVCVLGKGEGVLGEGGGCVGVEGVLGMRVSTGVSGTAPTAPRTMKTHATR